MTKINKSLCPLESTLRQVMEHLNKGTNGMALFEDSAGVLKGLMTDGDIRRAILSGASLDDLAVDYLNRDFVHSMAGRPQSEYRKMLSSKIQHLPIVDEEGRLIDIFSFKKEALLPVASPSLSGNELKYVTDCIVSNWISSQGEYVKKFEKSFSDFHGGCFALTTSSGTTALHLALIACGIGPGDEVIVPDSTFAASANVVVHTGACPVFVDVSPDHWTIEPSLIRKALTPRTKAILPVHLYGHPACMDEIMNIAAEYKLYVIEDCAESLGARINGRLTGTMGTVGCYSFFSNKVITTGEGGMVVTSDEALYHKMQQLRDHGLSKTRRYWHDYAGFNYRLTNLQAAVGLAQMEQIEFFLSSRKEVVREYQKGLTGIPGLVLPEEQSGIESIFWLYTVLVDKDEFGLDRDSLISRLNEVGIDSRPFFPALHSQPAYKRCHVSGCFPVAQKLQEVGISLPTGNTLPLEEVRKVCKCIKAFSKGGKGIK
ncbi:perosamine synthetase [Maridesulfovibrio ferrireducens]|uniref:GDP-perosamine synthase n=1 Tax=Maridesulfovibrio ferrireducens TaxID=246191 RepID=A0A1G9ERW1_9BACT|nr:aminotransferase class I/II-fold pyridoxal phosphate-dependent enzyme [Maridesulfovibrio ferrireducens]SDK78932.1 perosamine synthetase [Maridesulfovibrio ferrireducens]